MAISRFDNPFRESLKSDRIYNNDDVTGIKNIYFDPDFVPEPNIGYVEDINLLPFILKSDLAKKIKSQGTWEEIPNLEDIAIRPPRKQRTTESLKDNLHIVAPKAEHTGVITPWHGWHGLNNNHHPDQEYWNWFYGLPSTYRPPVAPQQKEIEQPQVSNRDKRKFDTLNQVLNKDADRKVANNYLKKYFALEALQKNKKTQELETNQRKAKGVEQLANRLGSNQYNKKKEALSSIIQNSQQQKINALLDRFKNQKAQSKWGQFADRLQEKTRKSTLDNLVAGKEKLDRENQQKLMAIEQANIAKKEGASKLGSFIDKMQEKLQKAALENIKELPKKEKPESMGDVLRQAIEKQELSLKKQAATGQLFGQLNSKFKLLDKFEKQEAFDKIKDFWLSKNIKPVDLNTLEERNKLGIVNYIANHIINPNLGGRYSSINAMPELQKQYIMNKVDELIDTNLVDFTFNDLYSTIGSNIWAGVSPNYSQMSSFYSKGIGLKPFIDEVRDKILRDLPKE